MQFQRNSGGVLLFALLASSATAQFLPNLFPFPNNQGLLETFHVGGGPLDLTGPFFQSLGTNGRSCASCHRPAQGWGISAEEVTERFELTQGLDPIFRTVDGSNCDHNIDTSTVEGRRAAYSLLRTRGLIRIALALPANAEFNVLNVSNPYGCSDPQTLSFYRRPLPATNLRYLSAVMWDGRESSPQTGTQKITATTNPADLLADLAHQAMDATTGHAQASTPPTAAQQQAIVDFERSLATAQAFYFGAGSLSSNGASGGPAFLGTQTLANFFIGINDPLGGNPQGTPFSPVIFTLFDAWAKDQGGQASGNLRASIARGQALFNSKVIQIRGVAGLNDDLNQAVIPGTCGTCHDTPNVGNHSVPAPLNIGVGDPASPLDVSYLPVITLQHKTAPYEIKTTTDVGRAMITGLWKDVGRMKGPVLRGLASRAPYFHNGSAQTFADVIEFYENRFQVGFTAQEKQDLIAFLGTL